LEGTSSQPIEDEAENKMPSWWVSQE
jgi:hypothetical protein